MNGSAKAPIASETNGVEVVASQVTTDCADVIREDARDEDRTASYIIKRILERHYAKRLKARAAQRAAQQQQRRAA